MRKAAIEDASVEMLGVFERVSTEARNEKKAGVPITRMVYYWTRKPLVVGRAVALACTLENPRDVEVFLGLSKDRRAYKTSLDRNKYRNMLGRDPSEITVLDPFAGTGSLMFPSAELGLDVTCADYNPLAYTIARGSLEVPAAHPGLAKEFERAAARIIDAVEDEVGQFYKPRYLAYIWVWCIRCTHCSQRVPLINQMYLSVKNKIGLRFEPAPDKGFTTHIVQNMTKTEGRSFTHKKGKVQCISCHNTIGYDAMTRDIAKNKDREMAAIQIQRLGRQGRKYILPSEDDRRQYHESVQYFNERRNDALESIPEEEILASHGKRNTLWIYGVKTWSEFFSGRQLLILSTLVKKIEMFCKEPNNPHIPILRIYLAFLVARLVDSYSYGVRWNPSADKPQNALSLRRPSIVFNLAEINPFERVSGSLQNNTSNIAKATEFCSNLKNSAFCRMESVTGLSDKQYDLIITDPPYGNDVQYGELSEFFYLWMHGILNDSALPARVPLDEDFCESQGRFGDKKLASEFFERGLKKSFVAISHKLKDDGLLAVFFAHSSTQAWNQLLVSLRAGSFRVVSSYALHTENKDSPIARGKTSFMSSIVVTCRKITGDSSGFIEDVIPDTEDRIRETLAKIPNDKLLTLPITDLLVMVYGRVLESCTRYKTLKSRSGNNEPDFELLLSNAQSVVMRLLVSRLTKSSMNAVGPRMALYILVKVFQGGKVSADDMLKITRAYNIEPSALLGSGIVERDGGAYTLTYLHRNEMDFPPENVARDDPCTSSCAIWRAKLMQAGPNPWTAYLTGRTSEGQR